MMDSIMSFAKENYDLICLMVGVIGVILSVVTLIYEIRQRKKKKESEKKEESGKKE